MFVINKASKQSWYFYRAKEIFKAKIINSLIKYLTAFRGVQK